MAGLAVLQTGRNGRSGKMNWYEKRVKQLGYNGCRNCQHQIEALRACEWLERGGDGVVHLICPRWEKKRPTLGELAEMVVNDVLEEQE